MKHIFALLALCMMSLHLVATGVQLYDLRCCHAQGAVFTSEAKPTFSWKITTPERDFVQTAWQVQVALSAQDLLRGRGLIWDSGKRKGRQSIAVSYDGTALQAATQYYWRVRIWDSKGRNTGWSEVQHFATALMTEGDWNGAKWIALEPDRADWQVVPGCHGKGEARARLGERCKEIGQYKLPQFRKQVTVQGEVRRATAYMAGLGHFDMSIDGVKVGNHFLDAGWTQYARHAQYVALDVTNRIHGQCELGVMLGNGFYNVPGERYYKVLTSFGAPKMRMLLCIEYADGRTEHIISDETWSVSESPITYSSIYGGESYDARHVAQWRKPVVTSYAGELSLQSADPLTIHSELPVQRILHNSKGYTVYDLGQNFAGIVRLKVRSHGSKTVILRPAELLNPDTTVNQSATGQPYFLTYTTRGTGEVETWQPQFTYYGLRYVQVEGDAAEIVELTGLHTCNAAPEVGAFTCSKPLFNNTYTLIDWAIRSNMASVLTDCPHREKLGWLEQGHLMQHSLLYRYDLMRLYAKMMEDMRQSQRQDGCIPSICPEYVRFADGFEDSPEWGSSFIICPWYIYKWYGDATLLTQFYPDMQRYMAYLDTKAQNGIVAYGLGDWFDIGPRAPGYSQLTAQGVTATAMYYYNSVLMEQTARLLGHDDDAEMYAHKAAYIREAFNRKYYDPLTRTLDRNSQTANAIALYVGLACDDNREVLLNNLIDDIRQRGNALTAGDVGYRYVLRVLEEAGRSDVIYDMNSRYDVPGYGWQLAHGATALTESWQAYGSVSNNHFMLGHLMEWFYSGLCGIRQAANSVGWDEIIIAPQPVGDVQHARCVFESPRGTIESAWQRDTDGNMTLQVTIPANAKAHIIMPGADTLHIGSGHYRFTASHKQTVR